MAVIKLVENYAVSQLRKDVRDSLMMTGEQAVLLQLFHAGDSDAVPCPQCGDSVYKSPETDCYSCYGTMFDGGVRQAMKVWALFTDHVASEQLSQRGTYQVDQRSVQFEAFPTVIEHDVIARVSSWNFDGTPGTVEGFYILQQVTRRSLRTGNRFGQSSTDLVAQKAQLSELSGAVKMIERYPLAGKTFAMPTESWSPISPGPDSPLADLLSQHQAAASNPLLAAYGPPTQPGIPIPGGQLYVDQGTGLVYEQPSANALPILGRKWWNGAGPPGTITGANTGDLYLDTLTGTVYELESGTPPTVTDLNQTVTGASPAPAHWSGNAPPPGDATAVPSVPYSDYTGGAA